MDCSGWYTTYDPDNHNSNDGEAKLERERQVSEEERRFEDLDASLEHPSVSR